MKRLLAILFPIITLISICNAKSSNTLPMTDTAKNSGDAIVRLHTTEGDITLRLFGDTPRHRDNFLKLVRDGVYDSLLFHRVINQFMIQGGDPESKNAPAGKMLGSGDLGYTLEAEITPAHFHRRGALAAAREGDQTNPERRSSASQFYIVTGKVYSPGQLDQMDRRLQMQNKQEIFDRLAREHRDSIMTLRRNRDQAGLQALQEELVKQTEAIAAKQPVGLSAEQREAYSTVGGTPHLDGTYTVYGEVIDGMDVVDRIQQAKTDRNDRPVSDIRILSAEIVEP